MSENKKLVLMTGGSGYIGSSVIKHLHEEYRVIILDTAPPASDLAGVEYRHFDMTSPEVMQEVLGNIREEIGEDLHSVIHLAGHYDFKGGETQLYDKVNVTGTRLLLQYCREMFNVGQFLFASSMLVYAASEPGTKITEDSPKEGGWSYPASKIKAEKVLLENHGKIPLVILRIAAVYNDYGYAPSIAQQILRVHEMHLTSFFFPGNRHHVQSAIHVDDLARAIELCLRKKDELPEVLTMSVAEDETPTYDQIQKEVSRLLHQKEIPYYWVPRTFAKLGAAVLSVLPTQRPNFIRPWMIRYADANYDLDNSLVKKVLGWRPERNLLSTLPTIVQNLDLYPGTWYRTNKSQRPPLLGLARTRLMKNLIVK